VISAILGLVSLPAGAEIIKVSISGMYDGENPYGTDVDEHYFSINYLVNSKSIVGSEQENYRAYPYVETGLLYRSFGSLQDIYYNNEDGFFLVQTTKIPFHAISGSFFGEYDDPYYIQYFINDAGKPFVDGTFMYNRFGDNDSLGYLEYISLHLPGGIAVSPLEAQISYTVLAPGSIPEPSTWVMLLVGFGFTGRVIRARRVRRSLAFC
jgi:hypothetical protein